MCYTQGIQLTYYKHSRVTHFEQISELFVNVSLFSKTATLNYCFI